MNVVWPGLDIRKPGMDIRTNFQYATNRKSLDVSIHHGGLVKVQNAGHSDLLLVSDKPESHDIDNNLHCIETHKGKKE